MKEVGGTQGRYLAAGNDAEAMEEYSNWLDLHDLLSLLSYTTQDHHQGGGHHPHQSLIKKMNYRLTYKWIRRRHSVYWDFFSQITPACVYPMQFLEFP